MSIASEDASHSLFYFDIRSLFFVVVVVIVRAYFKKIKIYDVIFRLIDSARIQEE
jgi:hypothetical protein